MKKILLFILGLTLLSGCEKENENRPISERSQNLFSILMVYGKELYDNKEYENYPKDENGLYIINLNDLEVLGYDISMFVRESGEVCDKEETNIRFDLEYKIATEGSIPIITSLSCEKDYSEVNVE